MVTADTDDAQQTTPPAAAGATWGVVRTHAHKERLAQTHLQRQGFRTYCPQLRRRVRHARRTQDVLRPMFPGYLFVRLDLERTRWRPILSTIGVHSMILCGDRPALLPNGLVESLQKRERDGAVVAPEAPYQAGQTVRFAGGPFDGVIATILSVGANDRLTVLMELLQGEIRAAVKASKVTPA